MEFPFYQLHAFGSAPQMGKKAIVFPVMEWPDQDLLQFLSEEMQGETLVFTLGNGEKSFELRFYKDGSEIDFDYAGALACAHLLFDSMPTDANLFFFETKRASLSAHKNEASYSLNIPIQAVNLKEQTLKKGNQKTDTSYYISEEAVFVNKADWKTSLKTAIKKDKAVQKDLVVKVEALDARGRLKVSYEKVKPTGFDLLSHPKLAEECFAYYQKVLADSDQISLIIEEMMGERKSIIHIEQIGDRLLITGECSLFFKGSFDPYSN